MAGEPLSANGGRKLLDIALPHELFDHSPRYFERLEERRGPQASTDGEPSNVVGDVDQASFDLKIWRFFEKNSCVQLSRSDHCLTPPKTRLDEGGLSSLSPSLTSKGKTAQNALLFQRVPIRDAKYSTNDKVDLPTPVAC